VREIQSKDFFDDRGRRGIWWRSGAGGGCRTGRAIARGRRRVDHEDLKKLDVKRISGTDK
jgi:hypothetical protein